MLNPQWQEFARTYAGLQLQAERHVRNGTAPPPNLMATIAHMQSHAQQNLHPAVLQEAIDYANTCAQAMQQQEANLARQQEAQTLRKGIDNLNAAARHVTEKVVPGGLNAAGYAAVLRGEKVQTKRGINRAKRGEELARMSEEVFGKKMSFEKFSKEMNYATDASDPMKELRTKYPKADPERLQGLVDEWNRDGVLIQLLDRRAPDEHVEEFEPDDDDVRRVQTVDSILQHGAEDQLADNIGDDYLTDDSRRGDVARAFAAVEGD
jgi:hypothetical protein